jgi:hypothetical protein
VNRDNYVEVLVDGAEHFGRLYAERFRPTTHRARSKREARRQAWEADDLLRRR